MVVAEHPAEAVAPVCPEMSIGEPQELVCQALPLGQYRVPVCLPFRKKFLNGGEDDTAGGYRQLHPQMRSIDHLHRKLFGPAVGSQRRR